MELNNYLGNPFSKIVKISDSQELLDVAFKKSSKLKPPKERLGPVFQSRTFEINRINTAANILTDKLERIVNNFPSLNVLHPFYVDLVEIITDIDELKEILGRIYGIANTIKKIAQELVNHLKESESKSHHKKIRKSAYGRFSSLIYQISPFLIKLEKIRIELNKLPSYNPSLPCVVVCGVPNVGKSSFIRAATSGKPEIASYPFTTKKLIFGHRNYGYLKIQFVDTPGLLDRDFEERNEIELQALAALKHLADIMVFLLDLSEQSNNSIDEQLNLLKEIKEFYPTSDFLIILTKFDLLNKEQINTGILNLQENKLLLKDEKVLTVSNNDDQSVDNLIKIIETLLEKNLNSNLKFRALMDVEIDPDFDLEEDETPWFLDL